MKLTVAICTWNRSAVLADTLASLTALTGARPEPWEVVVVDNNSTDGTPAVVASYTDRLPVRRVLEPRQGVAHARNLAAATARGSWLLFLDDDCRPAPTWLTSYTDAIVAWPRAGLFGGPIVPEFAVPPPRWIGDNIERLSSAFGFLDRGPTNRELSPREGLLSGNMLVATELARRAGFRTDLGRVADGRLGGEEIDFYDRLRASDTVAVWVSGALVRHVLPADKATRSYVVDSYEGAGRTEAKLSVDGRRSGWRGVPRWVLRRWVQSAASAMVLAPFRNRAWVTALTEAARMRGFIREIRSRS